MDKNIWKQLYTLINEWIQLEAWKFIGSNDFVGLEINGTTYYCTIMGQLGDCIGFSIYEGEQGYRDLNSISLEYEEDRVIQYMMFDQTCLTFYMGDREEVPSSQRQMMKTLGFKYRGKGNWPYFLSFQSRFYPYEINDYQAKIMIQVLEQLIPLMKAYINKEVVVDFDQDEMLYAHNGIYEARVLPPVKDKFPTLTITDKGNLETIPQSFRQFIIDLAYLKGGIVEAGYDRPISGLVLLAMELESQEIVYMNLLKVEEEQSKACLDMFQELLEDYGKPTEIMIRNPRVFCALSSICEVCGTEIYMTALPMIDDILDEMEYYMSK